MIARLRVYSLRSTAFSLLLSSCINTVEPLRPADGPAEECPPPSPSPLPPGCLPGCSPTDDVKWFVLCATGPRRRIPGADDSELWGYRGLDEECTLLGAQVYFQVCMQLDLDFDADVDLKDFSLWPRRPKGGAKSVLR